MAKPFAAIEPAVLDTLKRLHGSGIKLGLISNVGPEEATGWANCALAAYIERLGSIGGGTMRLAAGVLVPLVGFGLLLGGFGRGAAVASRHLRCQAVSGRLPTEFVLRPPLAPPAISRRQAVTVARRAGVGIRKPFVIRYGLWIASDRERVDVWEIRESHLTTDDPGGPNAQSCAAHRVYHHFLVIVGDKNSVFIEAAPY
jgi:hypothetical protein